MPRAKHGGYSKEALWLYLEALREEMEEKEGTKRTKEGENKNGFCSNREDDCARCSANSQCVQGMEEELGRPIEEVPSELGAGGSGQYFVAIYPGEVPRMLALV